MAAQRPESDIDLYTDEALLNPFPLYRELRDQAAAVWLNQLGMFVLSRYADVRAALRNWQTFSSAQGVTMNERMNEALKNGTLCSDTPVHDKLRAVITRPLTPGAIRTLTDRITEEAEGLADRLVARGSFDAVTDLATYLPVTIVSELVGLPEEGRERMLVWAAANFNCFGPADKPRTHEAFPIVEEMINYAFTQAVPGKLKPEGWAAGLYQAGERGELPLEQCPALMNDYMGPALDTTIFATASAIMLFGQNPDQWDLVRQDPSLIPNAVMEVIRIEAPIQGFSRYVAQDTEIEGVRLPQGSRAVVLYGSANRDERKWGDPDRFDVRRKVADHLGFGHGVHTCAGMHLARLEMAAIIGALAKRVKRFELGAERRAINNVLRGLESLPVTVH